MLKKKRIIIFLIIILLVSSFLSFTIGQMKIELSEMLENLKKLDYVDRVEFIAME